MTNRQRIEDIYRRETGKDVAPAMIASAMNELAVLFFVRNVVGPDANFLRQQFEFLAKHGYVSED